MLRRVGRARLAALGVVACTLGLALPASAQTAKKSKLTAKDYAALPAAPVKLSLIAPSPSLPWTYRVDNVGDKPIRVAADVRLLRFEIDAHDKKQKNAKCTPPVPFRPAAFPEERSLYLKPGESYIETFNPKLICFGKSVAAMTAGATVHARYGWEAPKWAHGVPKRPYVAEGLDDPPTIAPAREIVAPAVVLGTDPPPPEPTPSASTDKPTGAPSARPKNGSTASPTGSSSASSPSGPRASTTPSAGGTSKGSAPGGGSGAAKSTPSGDAKSSSTNEDATQGSLALADANAARIEVTQPAYVEMGDPRTGTITITAQNVGERSMTVAVRPRMIELSVDGPRKTVECMSIPTTHAVPRDNYRTLGAKQKLSITVVLHEICPADAFDRPGLYHVLATLDLGETGEEAKVHAYSALVPARAPTLVRLHGGPDPFYTNAPKPVPTPKTSDRPKP